jgi:hypothetical protein
MPTHQYLFIDLTGHVGKVETMESRDDDVAQTCADGLLACSVFDPSRFGAPVGACAEGQKSRRPPLVS